MQGMHLGKGLPQHPPRTCIMRRSCSSLACGPSAPSWACTASWAQLLSSCTGLWDMMATRVDSRASSGAELAPSWPSAAPPARHTAHSGSRVSATLRCCAPKSSRQAGCLRQHAQQQAAVLLLPLLLVWCCRRVGR